MSPHPTPHNLNRSSPDTGFPHQLEISLRNSIKIRGTEDNHSMFQARMQTWLREVCFHGCVSWTEHMATYDYCYCNQVFLLLLRCLDLGSDVDSKMQDSGSVFFMLLMLPTQTGSSSRLDSHSLPAFLGHSEVTTQFCISTCSTPTDSAIYIGSFTFRKAPLILPRTVDTL